MGPAPRHEDSPSTPLPPPGGWRRWLDPESPAATYAGVLLIAAGLALIAYAWSRVAGTLSVALQLPYVASSAFTGLGLVIVGATLISVAARRRDAAIRARQLDELAALLRVMDGWRDRA